MVSQYSVNAVRFGIQDLAPKFFHSRPEFVISGPNVGSQYPLLPRLTNFVLTQSHDTTANLGSGINGSGTVYDALPLTMTC